MCVFIQCPIPTVLVKYSSIQIPQSAYLELQSLWFKFGFSVDVEGPSLEGLGLKGCGLEGQGLRLGIESPGPWPRPWPRGSWPWPWGSSTSALASRVMALVLALQFCPWLHHWCLCVVWLFVQMSCQPKYQETKSVVSAQFAFLVQQSTIQWQTDAMTAWTVVFLNQELIKNPWFGYSPHHTDCRIAEDKFLRTSLFVLRGRKIWIKSSWLLTLIQWWYLNA